MKTHIYTHKSCHNDKFITSNSQPTTVISARIRCYLLRSLAAYGEIKWLRDIVCNKEGNLFTPNKTSSPLTHRKTFICFHLLILCVRYCCFPNKCFDDSSTHSNMIQLFLFFPQHSVALLLYGYQIYMLIQLFSTLFPSLSIFHTAPLFIAQCHISNYSFSCSWLSGCRVVEKFEN